MSGSVRSRHHRIVVAAVAAVAAQRVLELRLSRRHERALRDRGAIEHGAAHYPVMVAVHTAWLVGTAAEGWRCGRGLTRAGVVALAIFGAMQPIRWWIIRSLGDRWTTRVLTIPGESLRSAGPYRWIRHPNYAVVVVEIATLPFALGGHRTAAVGSLANAALLRHRIRVEERALGLDGSPARGTGTAPTMGDCTDAHDREQHRERRP